MEEGDDAAAASCKIFPHLGFHFQNEGGRERLRRASGVTAWNELRSGGGRMANPTPPTRRATAANGRAGNFAAHAFPFPVVYAIMSQPDSRRSDT